MCAKNYFDFEYDNKHIESVVKDRDLESLYGLIDEFSESIVVRFAKWYRETVDYPKETLLTDKEIFNWFKTDNNL